MWLVLKKKYDFVERIKVSSVLFELCISLQAKNKTSASVWIFIFCWVKQKNVTVSLRSSVTKWMNAYVKRWVETWYTNQQNPPLKYWYRDTDIELSSSEFCRVYSWYFSSYADWEPCYLSSNKSNINLAKKWCGSWNRRYVCGKTRSSKPILEQF